MFCVLFALKLFTIFCRAESNKTGLASMFVGSFVILPNFYYDDPPAFTFMKSPKALKNCENGAIYSWDSSNTNVPTEANEARELAYKIDRENNLITPSCQFCMCNGEDFCLTPANNKSYIVYLVPFCEETECHVYGSILTSITKKKTTYPDGNFDNPHFIYSNQSIDGFLDENGIIFNTPNPNEKVGKNSTFFVVTAIGCSGCEELKNLNCDNSQENTFLTRSEIIQSSANLTKNIIKSSVRPYGLATVFMDKKAYKITQQDYDHYVPCKSGILMFVAFTNSTIPLTYPTSVVSDTCHYVQCGLSGYDPLYQGLSCLDFCMCDEAGFCLTPIFPYYFHVDFVPYCDGTILDTECAMYGAIFFGLFKTEDGILFEYPQAARDPVSTNSGYPKIVSYGCKGCDGLKNLICLLENSKKPLVGLTIAHAIYNTSPESTSLLPPSKVEQCDVGVRLYWPAEASYVFYTSWDFNSILCQSFCVCDINHNCYTTPNETFYIDKLTAENNGDVHFALKLTFHLKYMGFLPLCDGKKCFMYLKMEGKFSYLIQDNGSLLLSPELLKHYDLVPVTSKSGHIKVDAISCKGCEAIRNYSCSVVSNITNLVGMTIATRTISVSVNNIAEPIGTIQCTNGIRFFWNSSNDPLPAKAYATSQAAFILDNLFDMCHDFCIRDVNGEFYVPSNHWNEDFANITFIPYCEDTDCYMYAVPTIRNAIQKRSGESFYSPDPNADEIGLHSSYIKVDALSCNPFILCDDLLYEKCYGDLVEDSTIKVYPYVEINVSSRHYFIADVFSIGKLRDPGDRGGYLLVEAKKSNVLLAIFGMCKTFYKYDEIQTKKILKSFFANTDIYMPFMDSSELDLVLTTTEEGICTLEAMKRYAQQKANMTYEDFFDKSLADLFSYSSVSFTAKWRDFLEILDRAQFYVFNVGLLCLLIVVSVFGGIKEHYRFFILNQALISLLYIFYLNFCTSKYVDSNTLPPLLYFDPKKRYNEYCFSNYRASKFIFLLNLFINTINSWNYFSVLLLTLCRCVSLYVPLFYDRIFKDKFVYGIIFVYDFFVFFIHLLACVYILMRYVYPSIPCPPVPQIFWVGDKENLSEFLDFSKKMETASVACWLAFDEYHYFINDSLLYEATNENNEFLSPNFVDSDTQLLSFFNYDYLADRNTYIIDRKKITDELTLICKIMSILAVLCSCIFSTLLIAIVLKQTYTLHKMGQQDQMLPSIRIAIAILLQNIVAFLLNFVFIIELVYLSGYSFSIWGFFKQIQRNYFAKDFDFQELMYFWDTTVDYWTQLGIFIDCIINLTLFQGYRNAIGDFLVFLFEKFLVKVLPKSARKLLKYHRNNNSKTSNGRRNNL